MRFIFSAALAAILGMNSTAPAVAEVAIVYPVSIPHECVELAQREGVPTVIENRYQAAKARLKLARLSGKDPLVQGCRAAVERARKAAVEAGQQRAQNNAAAKTGPGSSPNGSASPNPTPEPRSADAVQ